MINLTDNLEGGTTLDQVSGGLRFDHNASLRRVTGASAAVDEESGAAAHGVGAGRIKFITVRHSLKGHHVAQSVGSLRQWTNRDLALAVGIVAA